MNFENTYEDDRYASSYAKLEFPGTYYLAYRDIPALITRDVRGDRALDVGCGTGRSTRFLRRLGFSVTGVDIADEMLSHARAADPEGDYRLVGEGVLAGIESGSFDLALAAFTFDNVPTRAAKIALLREMRRVLTASGRALVLVSAPEIYTHEWASFSTKDFPENREAQAGDVVRIVVTALDDHRPVSDVLWPDEFYREVFADAGLNVLDRHQPLGLPGEGHAWVSELEISPWSIYVLAPTS